MTTTELFNATGETEMTQTNSPDFEYRLRNGRVSIVPNSAAGEDAYNQFLDQNMGRCEVSVHEFFAWKDCLEKNGFTIERAKRLSTKIDALAEQEFEDFVSEEARRQRRKICARKAA